MKYDYLSLAAGMVDPEYIRKHSLELNKLERTTANSDFKASTDYVVKLMKDAGISDVKRYAIPCDGVTTYDDCTMPLAWDRTGRSTLEVIDGDWDKNDLVIADTDVELLNAAIWSPPTPAGGITAELVSLQSAESDDWSCFNGKIVLCNRSPIGKMRKKLADAGALGLVSYEAGIVDTNPDDVRWMNGVGHCGWYYVKGDKQLWNFSITPRRGKLLDDKLAAGKKFTLKAVMNTRVYPGEIYTVTGLIPGKSSKELALVAHMYEPFPPDDAAGVVISTAIAKALNDLVKSGAIPQLEKSIRLVFTMERYGFAEYFSHPANSRRIIAAMNMDSVCHPSLKLAGVPLELRHSPASAPFFTEVILREYLLKNYPEVLFVEKPGTLSDDTFAADSLFNIPTGWLHTPAAKGCHHNTGEVFSGIDLDIAAGVFNIMTACFMELALVCKGSSAKALAKKIYKGVCADAAADFKRLAKNIKEGKCNSYASKKIGSYLVDYHTKRVRAVNLLTAGTVNVSEVKSKLKALRKQYAPSSLKAGDHELAKCEQNMANLFVTRSPEVRQLMNLIRVPAEERCSIIQPSMLLCALLDGKRDLYECYVISQFMLQLQTDCKEMTGLVDSFKKLAQYGYYTLN